MSAWVYNDGGRCRAGYKGDARDCVARAIAIASLRPYEVVYADLSDRSKAAGGARSARNGVAKKIIRQYLAELGWEWTPTMGIGTGCTVHLRADELPAGRIIVSASRHLVAVINGVIHDTHDSSRDGTRCVYGYWS